jgi:cytochrome c
MKTVLLASFIAFGVLSSASAIASPDQANTLCGKCHEMDKKKKGLSYKAMSAKYKGKEAEAFKAITDPKGDHPEVKAKPDEIKAVVKWVLQQ